VRLQALLLITIIVLGLAITVAADKPLMYSQDWNNGVVIVLLGEQYGTGWWVNDWYVVTAAHVVNYESHITVTLMHGDWISKGQVIFVDRVHDVAIIRAESKPTEQYIFKLSARSPQKGMSVYIIGYPFEIYKIIGDLQKVSSNPRVTLGIVAWVDNAKELFEFSAATDAGNSGGPIVDYDGNVIGLVSFAMKGEAATMYYGSSVDAIKNDLRQAGVSYSVSLSSMASGSFSAPSTGSTLFIALAAGGFAAIMTAILVIPVILARRGR